MNIRNITFYFLLVTLALVLHSCKSKQLEDLHLGEISGSKINTLNFDLSDKSYEYYGSNGWAFSLSSDNDADFAKLEFVNMKLYSNDTLVYQINKSRQDLVESNWVKNKKSYVLQVPGDFYSEKYKDAKFELRVELKYHGSENVRYGLMAHRAVRK